MKIVKTNDHHTIRCLLGLMMAVAGILFAACTDDPPGGRQKERVTLELRPYTSLFADSSAALTRAFPGDYNGYVTYENLYTDYTPQQSLVDATIHMFFTQQDSDPEQGSFRKSGEKWISTVEMESGGYYLYGFIPENVVGGATNIAPVTGGFEKGAKMTLKKLSSVVPADVCVTVAAGGGQENSGPSTGYNIGKFGIMGSDRFVYLLFDHLYSSLCFRFKVDTEYDKLRTIKIKKLRLKSSSMKKYYDATITLTANTTGANPLTNVTFSPWKEEDGTECTETADGLLFEAKGTIPEVELNAIEFSNFLGCFVPGDYNRFDLETTYDVYDKSGNRVRKDCVAENSIYTNSYLLAGESWKRGSMLKLSLTVKPTYLYMLSEPDLDNPTVTLK